MLVLCDSLTDLVEGEPFDLLVVGAGGAGLSAALFAALEGARVLIVEHTNLVGGSTAWSAGTTWVPGSQHAAQVNPEDSLEAARTYLNHAVAGSSPAALREAFLTQGPRAVQVMEARTQVKYRPYPKHPDYQSDLPGSTLCGRALEPLPVDGRLLGPLFGFLRPPIPEFTVLGGMMVDRTDINHLLNLTRSWASLRHSARILGRYMWDRLRYPRGTRLVMGNALIGRLLYSLYQHKGVTLALNTQLVQIELAGDTRHAVTLQQGEQRKRLQIRGGIILASGGFNRNPEQRAQLMPGIPLAWCPGAPGHTGQAQALARHLGAHLGQPAGSPAFWAPVSIRQRADGSSAVFPHFVLDRAKPGMITVDHTGQRFVNESTSYHLFGLAMQAAHLLQPSIPAYLIGDAAALQRYGMGMVRPGGRGLGPFLADGYLVQGHSLPDLASKLGLDAATLIATVARHNDFASSGQDLDFSRGTTAYQQNLGDPQHPGRNPNLGPLQQAPFYAIRLYPGDIGAATGLVTDEHARTLDAQGQPIEGLYAIGNDMQSIMGKAYPAPGITIGPGLVFAYIAAQHALGRKQQVAPQPRGNSSTES